MREFDTKVLGLALAIVTAACSSDDALGASGDLGTGSQGADEGQSTGGTGGGPAASDGDAEGGTDGAADDSGGAGIDCPAGDDCPACATDEQAWGIACLPCIAVDDELDLTVAKVDVVGAITFNGTPPPASEIDDGDVWLRDGEGDMVRLGSTHDPELRATIVPGVYDVVFAGESGGEFTADNAAAVVARGVLLDDSDRFEIDVQTTVVTGAFRFDGVDAPGVSSESGRVWLREPGGTDEILLGTTDAGEFWVNVVPGTYEVHYEAVAGGVVAPRNARAVLTKPVEIAPAIDGAQQRVDIDIPTAVWTGAITLDGATPPDLGSENGELWARELRTGTEVKIGETRDGSYYVRLVVGSYELYYTRRAGGVVVPINEHARVLGPLELAADRDAPVELVTAVLAGQFQGGDGLPPPADPTDDGVVSLRDATTGDRVALGNTALGGFAAVRVLAGAYAIHYGQDSSRGGVPANVDAPIGAAEIEAGTTALDVVIPSVVVSGAITLGGATPPGSDYNDGRIYLRSRGTGDSVLLASTRTGGYTTTVVPATYDVVYVVETLGGSVPSNNDAVLIEALEIPDAGEFALDIDVPVTRLSGTIAIVDAPTAPDPASFARIFATDVRSRDRIYLGSTAAGGYAQALTPGRYVITYAADPAAAGLPQNSDAALACIDLGG